MAATGTESDMPSLSTRVCGPALTFTLNAVCGRARATTLSLPHGPVHTPVFMPVGTQGTIKGVTTAEMQKDSIDCKILLGNTYHLGNKPGGDVLERHGGLHKFMNWDRNILTDSGGFQMVSLLHLAEITEEGVKFQSPNDGTEMMLTPEMSMQVQNQIGSDIMMALDDVVSSKSVDDARFTEACHRTLRWIDRCIKAHGRPHDQNLFGIVQGGLDTSPGGLRDICLKVRLYFPQIQQGFSRHKSHCHACLHAPLPIAHPSKWLDCKCCCCCFRECWNETRTCLGTPSVDWRGERARTTFGRL